MFTLYWISENGQGSIPMGDYASEEEAEFAIAGAEAEMLAEALPDDPQYDGLMTVAAIKRGDWEIVEY